MDYKQAISIIDGVIENAWLNLHEGHEPEEARELEAARKLTAIVPSGMEIPTEILKTTIYDLLTYNENKTDMIYDICGLATYDREMLNECLKETDRFTEDEREDIADFIRSKDAIIFWCNLLPEATKQGGE